MTSETSEDPTVKLAGLEAELNRVKAERDFYKSSANYLLYGADPYRTPTPEEVQEMMTAPRGEPLADIVAEFERRLASR